MLSKARRLQRERGGGGGRGGGRGRGRGGRGGGGRMENIRECAYCTDSDTFERDHRSRVIAESPRAYVLFQSMKRCMLEDQLLICPVGHAAGTVNLDEDVYEEMRNHMKSLVAYFDSKGRAPIFVETVGRVVAQEMIFMGGGRHCQVDVYAVPADRLAESKGYFMQALRESEAEWSVHAAKQVITTTGRKGPRGAVPSNFPYFHVDFSLGGGYAHAIEGDEFDVLMGRKVVSGVMELTALDTAYRDSKAFNAAVDAFKREFRPFDWTKHV
eukprot:GHVU01052022.1.p2 GENE.GHVU01052022.1~~GHVU01052022.1.p2  ORF type:complete len:270 (-),score=52.80 GHVU01052022.1:431-1240(-)